MIWRQFHVKVVSVNYRFNYVIPGVVQKKLALQIQDTIMSWSFEMFCYKEKEHYNFSIFYLQYYAFDVK
jgi:hypothetical protein